MKQKGKYKEKTIGGFGKLQFHKIAYINVFILARLYINSPT